MAKHSEDGRNGPDPRDLALGLKIREWRKSAGITQATLADAVGMTFQQIQKYERAFTRVSFSRLVQIARALGSNVAELTEGLDEALADAPAFHHKAAHLRLRGAPELLAAYSSLDEPRRLAVLNLLLAIAHDQPQPAAARAPVRTATAGQRFPKHAEASAAAV